MESIRKLLEDTTAGGFTFSEQASFVTVPATAGVQTAFRALVDHAVTSAPVFDPATHEWLGFVDMGDFAKYIRTCGGNRWRGRAGRLTGCGGDLPPTCARLLVNAQ